MKAQVAEIIADPQLTASATTEAAQIEQVEQAQAILTTIEAAQACQLTNYQPEVVAQLIKELQSYQQANHLIYQVVNSHGQAVDQALNHLISLQVAYHQPTPAPTW
jgi:hypothetical protein